jgi:integrase
MLLTGTNVRKLGPQPGAAQTDYKDDATPGLYLRAFASGRRTWILKYKSRGRARLMKLGDFGEPSEGLLGLREARRVANSARGELAEGRDPGADAQRQREAARQMPTVAEFVPEYLRSYRKRDGSPKKTLEKDREILEREVVPVIGRIPMNEVTGRDVTGVLDRIAARGAVRLPGLTLAILRRFFRHARSRGVSVGDLPTEHTENAWPSRRRDVTLTDRQLRAVWAATDPQDTTLHPSTAAALRMLLLAGQRATETASAAPSEFDLKGALWTIPPERTKNGRMQLVPLSGMACDTMRAALNIATDQWAFPAARGGGALRGDSLTHALRRILPNADPRPGAHDLRRTVATRLQADLSIDRHVIAAILNHSDHTATGRYLPEDYLDSKRAALDAWATRLSEVLAAEDDDEEEDEGGGDS